MVGESVLSMRPVGLGAEPASRRASRLQALSVLAVAAALLHAALLGGVEWGWPEPPARRTALVVRTVELAAEKRDGVGTAADLLASEAAARVLPRRPAVGSATRSVTGRSSSKGERVAASAAEAAPAARAAPRSPQGQAPLAMALEEPPPAAAPSIATAAGDAPVDAEPIPWYPTRIAPAARAVYALRRGAQTGSATLDWAPGAEAYALRLEARIDGQLVLAQTSEGTFDGAGLAPLRFGDRRPRRQWLATNFQRAAGTISFSGSSSHYPLQRGTQDRLSWILQLAAIAAAAPQRLVADAVVAMAVVGVRGEPDVWAFRCAGPEAIETAEGPQQTIRLLREARGLYDTRVEVWLDPRRHFLPVKAVLGSSVEAQTLELVLQRLEIEP